VEDTIELDDIHHGRTVLKATLDGDLESLQQDLVRVRDLLDDEHDRVARDLGVEKNKKLHLENHQVYHYSLRITKAVSLCFSSAFNPGLVLGSEGRHACAGTIS